MIDTVCILLNWCNASTNCPRFIELVNAVSWRLPEASFCSWLNVTTRHVAGRCRSMEGVGTKKSTSSPVKVSWPSYSTMNLSNNTAVSLLRPSPPASSTPSDEYAAGTSSPRARCEKLPIGVLGANSAAEKILPTVRCSESGSTTRDDPIPALWL